jgi:hypothetical protein
MRRHAFLRAFRKHGRGCMGRDTPDILRALSGTLQTPHGRGFTSLCAPSGTSIVTDATKPLSPAYQCEPVR